MVANSKRNLRICVDYALPVCRIAQSLCYALELCATRHSAESELCAMQLSADSQLCAMQHSTESLCHIAGTFFGIAQSLKKP
jgi:hypothetical protein